MTGYRVQQGHGLLLEAHYDFLKRWSSTKKWWHFGLLFVWVNLKHFNLNKQFQNIRVVSILRFQKWFDVDILGFQIEHCCRLEILDWRLFGLLFEKLGNFLKIFWCFTNILWADFLMKVFCAVLCAYNLGFVIFWRKDFDAKVVNKKLVKLTRKRLKCMNHKQQFEALG